MMMARGEHYYIPHFERYPAEVKKHTAASYALNQKFYKVAFLSMDGCARDTRAPLGTLETLTLPAVPTVAAASDCLKSAIFNLKSSSPRFDSGIIRVEVPILQQIDALQWLRSQGHSDAARCFFSTRDSGDSFVESHEDGNGHARDRHRKIVSVAGLGSAVFFRQLHPFSLQDWLSIRRFLNKKCPLIRAYGALRFDATSSISAEWMNFGSFYFMIPQVEFDELSGTSILAATVAWDNVLSWNFEQAIATLEATLCQVSAVLRTNGSSHPAVVLQQSHAPDKYSWDSAVKKALKMITSEKSPLVKVVLARSSRVMTATEIDPLEWLTSLQAEGDDAYQFCIQPPESPAFIGNTPERLFHRHRMNVSSEALAGTRARGGTESLDLVIGNDLLSSAKDHHEFAVVRDCIRRKFESVCSCTLVEPNKALRKLPRVQHLYAKVTGTLQKKDDEFMFLSSLHPTPAVCGLPMEEARALISETESFDRGMYAGPVGWFGGEESEFAVGIRSALVGKGIDALIYAGTGIVEGSDSSLEWQELNLKTSQFTRMMNLGALLWQ